jgi:hypothetical protein
VKRLLRDICEAAHSTDGNGDALIATSEVEELLERIAKMRRSTKTAIKDEYKHIERAEFLQDGEFFQLPEGASEQHCAPGFYFEPPSEEVQTERALAGQPPSRGFICRKPTLKEPFPTRICDALFTEARVVLPGSLGPALVLEAPQADGTTNRMLLPEADIIRDPPRRARQHQPRAERQALYHSRTSHRRGVSERPRVTRAICRAARLDRRGVHPFRPY